MRKLYLVSGFLLISEILLTTALLVSADAPTTPFDYTEGDDDNLDVVTSVQVSEGYDGDFSELALISEADAKSIASTYTSGGDAKDAELEAEKGNVVWEVEVKFEGNEFAIVIDAGNGNVIGAFYETESLLESWFDRD
jgi:hypothetical protein